MRIHRCWLWSLAVVAACSDPARTRVVVTPGPSLVIEEGEPVELQARVEPEASAHFAVELDPETAELVSASVDDNGKITLLAQCHALPHGSPPGVVDLVVTSTDVGAEPEHVSLEIHEKLGGECGPQVDAWIGDCSQPAPGLGDTLDVPLLATLQTLCVRMTLPDRDRTDVWLTSAATPQRVIALRSLGTLHVINTPAAEDDVQTFALAIPDVLDTFRGRVALAVDWQSTDPADGVAPEGGRDLTLVAGVEGDHVIDWQDPQLVAREYSITSYRYEISYFAPLGKVPCTTAHRVSVDTSGVDERNDIRLVSPSGTVADDGVLMCEPEVRLELWPPIDALPLEDIELGAYSCRTAGCDNKLSITACCTADPSRLTLLETRTVQVATDSVAELKAVDGASLLACVDVDNDGVPEVTVAKPMGTTVLSSATKGRLTDETMLAETPTDMKALWFEDRALLRDRSMLVGQFATQPPFRELTMSDDGGWQWSELPWNVGTLTTLRSWAPLGETPLSGARYFVAKADVTSVALIDLTCSVSCPAPITWTFFPNQGNNLPALTDVATADADGDGDMDLILVTKSGGNVQPIGAETLSLHVVKLDWTEGVPPTYSAPIDVQQPLVNSFSHNSLRMIAVGGACPTLVFFSAGSQNKSSVVTFTPNGSCDSLSYTATELDTFGRALGIGSYKGHVLISSETGIWEYIDQPPSWTPRDPELIETSQAGEIPIADPSSKYGQSFESCLVDPAGSDSMAFLATPGEIEWSTVGVSVGSFTEGPPP